MSARLSTTQKIVTNVTNGTVSDPTSSTVTSSTLGISDLSLSDMLKGVNAGTNSLDAYDNVTYHVKMSVVYKNYELILVESGKTDLIIESFEIDSTLGPNFRVRNIPSVEMRLTLREAVGVSLFDKLFAIQDLFSIDFKSITYRFTLSFKGYDTNGNIVNNIGNSYTWTTIMNDMNYKLDESGSIYNLSFVSLANTAFSDELGCIQFGGSVPNLSGGTLGNILSSLATAMNDQVKNDNGGIQRVNYVFKDVPYSVLGIPLPIDASSPFGLNILTASGTKNTTVSSRNNDVTQITKGTQISKFIDSLLSNSDDQNALLLNKKKPTNKDLFVDNDSVYSVHHRIIATVSYGDFIPAFNDYMKTVTYTIVPKLTHSTVQSVNQVNTSDNSYMNWSLSKVKSVVQNSIFSRKYDYIFTGKNTEVYDFTIKGQMPYAVNFPSMTGMNTSISSQTIGQVMSNKMANNQITSSMWQAQQSKNATDALAFSSGSDFTTNINGTVNASSLVQDYRDTALMGQAIQSQAVAARKSTEQKLAMITSKSNYMDDIVKSNGSGRNICIPVQFTSQQNDQAYSGNVERSPDGRESIYSTIMNQVYGIASSDMTDITLSIRYDPYWLGNVSTKVGSSGVNLTYDLESNYCNYDIKDMCMLFDFNVPTGFSEKTGQPIIKRDDMFTGMYIVHTVKHKFGGGQMSQDLHAVRIMSAPLSSMLKQQS